VTPRERDQSLDTWLRHARSAPSAITEDCLDAETMAAWVDGGLSGALLEHAEFHVAQCARCQILLGTMARAEAAAAAPLVAPRPAWRRWLSVGVPMVAAATIVFAVAVWFNATRPPRQSTETAALQEDRATGQTAPQSARPAASANAVDSLAAPAAPAPSAGAGAGQGPSASRDRRGLAALRESVDSIEFVSREGSSRWRITGSAVQRSTDTGATWQMMATGTQATFTAGAAPSASVCWLVGRGGVVLLTTDGNNWRRLAFPEPADLNRISAEDARAASVTTVDGRTFATADGGASWSER
jgi:hypothetical protein